MRENHGRTQMLITIGLELSPVPARAAPGFTLTSPGTGCPGYVRRFDV